MRNISVLKFKYKDKNIAKEDLENYHIKILKEKVRNKNDNIDIEILSYTSFDDSFDRKKYITKSQFCKLMPKTDSIKSTSGKYLKFEKLLSDCNIKPVALDLKGYKVYDLEDIISALKVIDFKLYTIMFL